jgi:hypothetical protein
MAFDPYYTWLGIRPDEQPPNHYRLLGLSLFEDNAAVIDHAADRQMAHVRNFQTGPHAAASQRLLSEITLARITLHDPQKRAAYHAELRKSLEPLVSPESLAETQPIVVAVPPELAALNAPVSTPAVSCADDAAASIRRKKKPAIEVAKIVAGGLAGLVLSVLLLRYVALIDITGLLPVPEQQPATVAQRSSSKPNVIRDAKKTAEPSDVLKGEHPEGAPVVPQSVQAPIAVDTNPTEMNEPEGSAPGAGNKKKKKGKQKSIDLGVSTPGAIIAVARMKPIAIQDEPGLLPELRGGTRFDWIDRPTSVNVELGKLEFEVNKTGMVYLAAEWNPRLSGGDWTKEALSQEQLVEAGWEHLGECKWRRGEELPVQLFRKICNAGETYSIRVSKYWPPLPFLPPPESFAIATPSTVTPPASRSSVRQEKRLAVPSAVEQHSVNATLEELYGLSKLKSEAEKLKVAGDLRRVAEEAKDRPAEQFTALRQAAELAQEAGDAKLLAQCIDEMAQRFDIDLLLVEATMFAQCAKNALTAEAIESLVLAARPVVLFALAEGEFAVAKRLTDATMAACARQSGLKYRKAVSDGQKEVNRLHGAWQAYEQALEKLQVQPDDVAANLTAGNWLCLERADWEAALPNLARAGNPALQKAAMLELSRPIDTAGQLAAADAWYDAGIALPMEPLWLLRARLLYSQAKRGSLDGLAAAKVERRLDELAKVDDLKPIVERFERAAARGRLRPELSPIIRRHCVLAFAFEPGDFLLASDKPMLRDLSGQENHGSVHGTSLVAGRAGSAFQFQADEDYVESPDHPSLNPEGAFTICAWIFQHSPVHPGGVDDIVSKDEWGGGTGRGFALRLHDRKPDINFGSGPEWLTVRAPQDAETKKWLHLAGVYDGQHEALFIDGVEVASIPCTKPMSVSSRPIRIGRGPFAQDRRFHGLIDEVAMFDIGLTAEDVRLLYDLGKSGTPLAK